MLLKGAVSMTLTPNSKRRSEIRVLPKMQEPWLILANFSPVSNFSKERDKLR